MEFPQHSEHFYLCGEALYDNQLKTKTEKKKEEK
jgi:hypothetical protein